MKFQEFSRNPRSLKHTLSGKYGITTIHIDMGLFFLILVYIQNRIIITYFIMASRLASNKMNIIS